MKRFATLTALLLMLGAIPTIAQNHTVKGLAVDRETDEPLAIAAVQLLSLPDSSQVKGTVTSELGHFSFDRVKEGKYTVKISYVGYHTLCKDLTVDSKSPMTIDLKTITVNPDTKLLEEAVIVAEVPKVQAVKDTLVFNSAAYRVAEGSSIQELIKKLPGVEVNEDGSMTVNGKEVTQILINGKEYMSDDLETLLKNLPANVVDRLKTYEKKSDLARITGIDDGEEQTVFDLQIKKDMMGGLMTNIDLAYGSSNLYNGKTMVNRFTDEDQFQLFANASNVIDQGVGNGGRQWGNNRGQNTRQDLFGTYAHRTDKFEFNSNIGVSHNENDFRQRSSSEMFYGARSTYSNSRNSNQNQNNSFRANFYIEWKPDTMTNIIFRPYFNTSKSEGRSESASATFSDNPLEFMDDPLYEMQSWIGTGRDTIFTNRNTGRSNNSSNGLNGSYNLQINRKLNNKGRNITFRSNGGFNTNQSENSSYNTTDYYKLQAADGGDSINIRNRYTETPSGSWNINFQFMYSEPIFKNVFWQTSYRINYSTNYNDRQTYQFDNMGLGYGERPDDIKPYLDASLSKYAKYTTLRHDIQTSVRVVRDKFNMNVGVRYQPYSTRLEYTQGESYDLTKHLYNLNPTFDFRFNFTDQTNMRIRYNGNNSQPSMTNLLPITDNTNPLYITMGNPDLKPSFTNNLNFDFHTFNSEKQSGFMTHANFSTTKNSISNMVTYNPENGGQITKPENINGNWRAYGTLGGNIAMKDKRFTVDMRTGMNYSNQVGYLNNVDRIRQTTDTIISTTKTMSPDARISASFRDEKAECTVQGNVRYNRSRNDVRQNGNIQHWDFSYGASGNLTLPWDIRVYADILMSSRRGYDDPTFNTDELIWNMQVSKSFLKNKAAMISAQFFDILGQRKNYNRNISATSKSDTEYNAINQYFLIHFTYRLNLFNGKMVEEEEGDYRRGRGGRGHGRW